MESPRIPVLLVGGLSPVPTEYLVEQLRTDGTVVVHHDLRDLASGVVRRRLRLGKADQLTPLELAHGCVSCTIRYDLLPLLRTLAAKPTVRRIVVQLDPIMEPEPVCWEMHHTLIDDRPVIDEVTIDGVVTVVDAASWLADATSEDAVADRHPEVGFADERTLAQVAMAQVEFSDVVAFAGEANDAWTAARTAAVLHRVAPTAELVDLATAVDAIDTIPATAIRGRPRDPHDPLLLGQPPLVADCGVTLSLFHSSVPFHPQRLHRAIDVLLEGVARVRGRAWVASQPDVAFWLESAGGGLGIGHAGPWLAAPDGPAWDDVSPERRTLAALRWHPEFGDRAQELVIVTHRADPQSIEAALTHALLTEAELADGPQVWRTYSDPFGEWHADPCDGSDVADGRADVDAGDRDDPR